MTNLEKLQMLQQAMLTDRSLLQSSLAQTATQLVFGHGNPQAKIMLIGEAPGRQEDKQGRPFVGSAGKLLSQCLAQYDLKLTDVWITNLVKYRPPNNRDPLEAEKGLHAPYLEEEINIIKPQLIIALGRHAGSYFMADLKISQQHGQLQTLSRQDKDGIDFEVDVAVLYHPAAALYNPELLSVIEQDFEQLSQLNYFNKLQQTIA